LDLLNAAANPLAVASGLRVIGDIVGGLQRQRARQAGSQRVEG